VENLAGDKKRSLELMVDTGALYSIVPAKILLELGIIPLEKLDFEVADGNVIIRDVGEARFRVDGRRAVSPVIFGEESDASVLGVFSLEAMALQVDPVRKEILPIRRVLYRLA
jgi:predicted aspartyl protease